MRRWILLLVLLTAPLGAAQWNDAIGDVERVAEPLDGGPVLRAPEPTAPGHLDIASVDVAEGKSALNLTLHLAEPMPDAFEAPTAYEVTFRFREREYLVRKLTDGVGNQWGESGNSAWHQPRVFGNFWAESAHGSGSLISIAPDGSSIRFSIPARVFFHAGEMPIADGETMEDVVFRVVTPARDGGAVYTTPNVGEACLRGTEVALDSWTCGVVRQDQLAIGDALHVPIDGAQGVPPGQAVLPGNDFLSMWSFPNTGQEVEHIGLSTELHNPPHPGFQLTYPTHVTIEPGERQTIFIRSTANPNAVLNLMPGNHSVSIRGFGLEAQSIYTTNGTLYLYATEGYTNYAKYSRAGPYATTSYRALHAEPPGFGEPSPAEPVALLGGGYLWEYHYNDGLHAFDMQSGQARLELNFRSPEEVEGILSLAFWEETANGTPNVLHQSRQDVSLPNGESSWLHEWHIGEHQVRDRVWLSALLELTSGAAPNLLPTSTLQLPSAIPRTGDGIGVWLHPGARITSPHANATLQFQVASLSAVRQPLVVHVALAGQTVVEEEVTLDPWAPQELTFPLSLDGKGGQYNVSVYPKMAPWAAQDLVVGAPCCWSEHSEPKKAPPPAMMVTMIVFLVLVWGRRRVN